MTAFIQNFGLGEWLIVLVILLVLFGAKKLPDLARSLGRSTKEFKSGLKEGATEEPEDDEAKTTEAKPTDG